MFGLALLVALGSGAAADARFGDAEALPHDDPAARRDPAVLRVRELPRPTVRGVVSVRVPNEEVAYDLAERAEHRQPLAARRRGDSAYVVQGRARDADLAPAGQSTFHPRVVFGSDQRVYIDETTDFPWRTVCRLVVHFPNDPDYYGGSGVLIGSRWVLTAGHVVYDSGLGGWADIIQVIPGQDGSDMPYGSAFGTQTRTYSGWTDLASNDHDFALVTLDRDIGNQTGWLGFGYYRSYAGLVGNLPGYPLGAHDGTRLYYGHGPIRRWSAFRVFHRIDSEGGQSGSAIYRRKRRNRIVFAVHTGSLGDTNQGTRIDRDKFASLRSWIASGE